MRTCLFLREFVMYCHPNSGKKICSKNHCKNLTCDLIAFCISVYCLTCGSEGHAAVLLLGRRALVGPSCGDGEGRRRRECAAVIVQLPTRWHNHAVVEGEQRKFCGPRRIERYTLLHPIQLKVCIYYWSTLMSSGSQHLNSWPLRLSPIIKPNPFFANE